MFIELEAVLAQVLPESGPVGPPFNLNEITEVANGWSDKPIPYSRVHRAWRELYDSPETKEMVTPLRSGKVKIELSAPGARRVLRRVWSGQIPRRIKNHGRLIRIEQPSRDAG